jgi:cyclopropane-fatty-acyl-phospholipid synthase
MFERLFFHALKPLNKGSVAFTTPKSETIICGDPHTQPLAHVTIHNSDFYRQCILYGDIGFGESYTAGHWSTDNLIGLLQWFIINHESAPTLSGSQNKQGRHSFLNFINSFLHILRRNTILNSKKNISEHYDLSNAFFKLFLDESMTYSAAYFKDYEETLTQAQYNKYEALCQKIHLKPTDHVLEIGCGWGGFAEYAAKHYGCKIRAVTISEAQFQYAKTRIHNEHLSDKVSIELLDYRKISGTYDKIISIEMLEAVGDEFLKTYFSALERLLKPDGLIGLQFIICADQRYANLRSGVDWIQKHIFPGSQLLSITRIQNILLKSTQLGLHSLETFGASYAETLRRWRQNFNNKINEVRSIGFSDIFIRKWNYYLSYCEAAFACHHINVVQAIYSRHNNPLLMHPYYPLSLP